MSAPLFRAGPLSCAEIVSGDLPALQRFFQANPEYHIAVTGDAPAPDEAQQEFESLPPPDWPFERKWLLRFDEDDGSMIGMANLISNLFVDGVWHLGLFVVATRFHGSGVAHVLYPALETWMRARGARWSRLGVVEGNTRAERFWARWDYVELRKRRGVEMGRKVNDVRVMAKPLAGGTLADYLALVARDRPESP